MPKLRIGIGLVGAAFCLALVGCGDDTANQVAAMNKSNMQRLCNLYAAHQNMKGGKGPKDEADFKTYIKEFDPDKLSMMGINPGKLDELFTSERDGQPFKFRFSVGGGRGSVDAVVFEQTGKDGKRQVGFTGGTIEDVDEATYKDYLAGKKPAAAAATGGPGGGVDKGSGRPKGGGAPVGAPKGPGQ